MSENTDNRAMWEKLLGSRKWLCAILGTLMLILAVRFLALDISPEKVLDTIALLFLAAIGGTALEDGAEKLGISVVGLLEALGVKKKK